MKLFLIICIIGILGVISLYFTHEGIFYKRDEVIDKSSDTNSDSIEIKTFKALPPYLFIKVIMKNDSNYAAGMFHSSSFKRTRSTDFITFKSDDNPFEYQWIYCYDKEPNTYFYVFESETNAIQFMDSVRSASIKTFKAVSKRNNEIYKIDRTSFEYIGYNIDNAGFTVLIYNLDEVIQVEKQRIRDTINRSQLKNTKPTKSDSFDFLKRDKKGRIILPDN